MAYQVALPSSLAKIHNAFHVLILTKYVLDSSHLLDYWSIQISKDMTYEEQPV